jgi:hypothetical protein
MNAKATLADDICRRVWNQRFQISRSHGFDLFAHVEAFVGSDLWARLLIESEWSSGIHPGDQPGELRIFGAALKPDNNITDDRIHIRFPEILA